MTLVFVLIVLTPIPMPIPPSPLIAPSFQGAIFGTQRIQSWKPGCSFDGPLDREIYRWLHCTSYYFAGTAGVIPSLWDDRRASTAENIFSRDAQYTYFFVAGFLIAVHPLLHAFLQRQGRQSSVNCLA